MKLPKVLVIDDQFSGSLQQRHNLCKAYRLNDVTGDDLQPFLVEAPLVDAVFSSAQHVRDNRVENSIDVGLEAARAGWPNAEGTRWALCLLDLRFVSGARGPGGMPTGQEGDDDFGLEMLRELQRVFPLLPVVILSSRDRTEVIQACRELGASDFIQRHDLGFVPPDVVFKEKLHHFGLLEDIRGVIVGRSVALLRALAAARRAATGSGNILLLGESGTGKELFARYVHDSGPRPDGPYKVFDAFGTAESLQEDVLFGHERGAFTGASRERRGVFEEADGGTLFVDEVGNIGENVQSRLLRPIEARTVTRQGGSREITVSLQLVLATNKALHEHARTGRFKDDLLNRIDAFSIKLPALRERREDVPAIAMALLERLCVENGLRWPRRIEPQAMQKLIDHEWRDGNIRALRNTLERAAKNHREAEIVVASDLDVVESIEVVTTTERAETTEEGAAAPRLPIGYDALLGSWNSLQRTTALQMCERLGAALAATARRSPADGAMRSNLAGAVGCLLGRKVTTLEAADFVKRVLRFDVGIANEVAALQPLLGEAFEQSLRTRPRPSSRSNTNPTDRS
ncbi:MAG TPA: sigma 54-interacting transcriptional regulator [Polyangiaceae bacterium]